MPAKSNDAFPLAIKVRIYPPPKEIHVGIYFYTASDTEAINAVQREIQHLDH